jgi:DNA-binding GntR family transcriptional regulator
MPSTAPTREPLPFDLNMVEAVLPRYADLHATATLRGADALTPDHFARLDLHDAALTTALAEGRIADAIEADDAFHQVLLDAAGDPDLQVSVDLLLPRMRRMDLWIFTRKALGAPESTHPGIIAALERGDADDAAERVRRSYLDPAQELAAALAGRDR